MEILSHRGRGVGLPENTLPAFEAALAAGASGIECDVRVAADGALVLVHDPLLACGTAVSRLSREQLAEHLGHAVPTVEDALAAFPDARWNLECKVPEAIAPVLSLARAHEGAHPIVVSSFWHAPLLAHATEADVPLGLLLGHAPAPSELDVLLAARASTLVLDLEFVDARTIDAVHAAGMAAWCYRADTPDTLAHAATLGLDVAITDAPAWRPPDDRSPAGPRP